MIGCAWLSTGGGALAAEDQAMRPGSGTVRLDGRSFADDGGPFLGLGASYFQALRDARHDRPRLERNLSLLSSNGFNYVRVLSMVSWEGLEIAPVAFTNRAGHTIQAWPDYWAQFRDLFLLAGERGLRVELTIFADAQRVMPSKTARVAHMDAVLKHLAGLERHVMHLEVANEAWQNGFPGAEGERDLREFAEYLASRTDMLVAITSNDHESNKGIISLYRGSAADLATIHFSRDTRTVEGGWLPVRDSWRALELPGVPPVTSNEPIGPGSSVAAEDDPVRLCSAAAFAFVAGLPGYVFHCRAGIFGYDPCCPPAGERLRFESAPGIDAYRHLARLLPPDVASWNRNDGLEPAAPFTVYCDDTPNRYWPESAKAKQGCVRNIGASRERAFVCLPMGVLEGGVRLEARARIKFEVFDPLTGDQVARKALRAGERMDLRGAEAFIIRGRRTE